MNNRPLILIVDDDPLIRELIERVLGEAGFGVVMAPDGITALRLLEEVKPDLILLDVMMPGLDGNHVIHEVREKSDLPIIMLTAKSEDKDVYQSLAGGADDFIRKPFNAQEMVARIRTMLRRTSPDTI